MLPTCTWCASDAFIDEYDPAEDIAWCVGPGHPEPRLIEPQKEAAARREHTGRKRYAYGLAHELGLHDEIPLLLSPGEWVETGAVEYRYGVGHPATYALMLERWGHVAQSPRKYSVTSFIGATLGHLSRATNITYQSGPGTGFFSYNSSVGYWTLEPVPETTTVMSWERLAALEGHAPGQWPLA